MQRQACFIYLYLRVDLFRNSRELGSIRSEEPLVGWEVGTFRHGPNPPPSGVGDRALAIESN